TAYSISDAETINTIRNTYQQYGYLLDPHGAVGFNALEKYFRHHPQDNGFIVETASPLKFYDLMEPIINDVMPVPAHIQHLLSLPKQSRIIENNVEELASFLRKM
ncbi:MAG TPA: threonine synthase, partial [Ferruginibacter sp.]|nr:threonine synthase [Ferruginibacter sp.]